MADARFTHGKTNTPEYRTWCVMKSRCLNPKFPKYSAYGARGIAICERWRNSFANFLADMGPRPSPQHTIDRFPDQNGSYEPGNCRWATPTQQARNRSITVTVEYHGRTVTLAELSEMVGIKYDTLHGRIARGMSAELAVAAPLCAGRKKLTPEQVKAIREEYARGDVSQAELGNRYGIGQTAVGKVVRGESYAKAA